MFNLQLRDSQLATHSVMREKADMERRYQEKVGQWESSQEALDQLTDELQANQNILRESQQKLDHFKSLTGSLQGQVDLLKQQVRTHVYISICRHKHKSRFRYTYSPEVVIYPSGQILVKFPWNSQ